MNTYMQGAKLPLAQVMGNLKLVNEDDGCKDARDRLKYGEIPPSGSPINEELLRTLGTDFLWPSSPDPDEFARAVSYLLPRIPADEMEEAAGVPFRNRT